MLDIAHDVVAPEIDERQGNSTDPKDHVTVLARKKAEKVAEQYADACVIGADTIVSHDDDILGKPRSREDAVSMLKRLSGNWHKVYTGITLIDGARSKKVGGVEVTKVKFRELTDWEILTYASTAEPHDKAGAYAIQGYGAAMVDKIDGCFYNVIGLPVGRLIKLFNKIALEYRFGKLVKMGK